MRVPPYAYGQIDPFTFLLFPYIGRSVENPKSKSAKTNCGEVRVFPTAHRTKPCTPQTDHKNLRVRRCVRVVPTRRSRPLSHAQRRTQFPLANMVRARTSLGASSRAAGGRGTPRVSRRASEPGSAHREASRRFTEPSRRARSGSRARATTRRRETRRGGGDGFFGVPCRRRRLASGARSVAARPRRRPVARTARWSS